MCKKISPGCDNCYASTMNRRYGGEAYGPEGEPLVDTVQLNEKVALYPLGRAWSKPATIFLSSMTDVYGDWVQQEWLDTLYAVMALSPHNTYQVLTKRPSVGLEYLQGEHTPARVVARARELHEQRTGQAMTTWPGWPLPNVWQGTSIENRRYLWRMHVLAQMPAAARFVSAEPLLDSPDEPEVRGLPDLGVHLRGLRESGAPIHWLILGGESAGPHERAMVERCPLVHGDHPSLSRANCTCSEQGLRPKAWALEAARQIRDDCLASGTAFFLKQWGGFRSSQGGKMLDGREWNQMPDGAGGILDYDKDALIGAGAVHL